MTEGQNKMEYPGKRKKYPRWVILKNRVETTKRVFYPGDYVDLQKYPEVREALYGARHSERSYVTK